MLNKKPQSSTPPPSPFTIKEKTAYEALHSEEM